MELGVLIPIAGVVVGVPGFVAFVALMAGHSRRMKELALREKELELGGGEAAWGPVVDALSDQLNETRAQVAELQERLDFTERVLTSGKQTEGDGKA